MKKFDFKKWRDKHGLTQILAAKIMGIGERQYRKIEGGLVTKNHRHHVRDCQEYDKKINSK